MSVATEAAKRGRNARRRDKPRRSRPTPVRFGAEQFKVTVKRRGLDDLPLTDLTESVSWERPGSAMSGTLTSRQPVKNPSKARLHEGDVAVLSVSPAANGRYSELWRMRIHEPELTMTEEQVVSQLQSGLAQTAGTDVAFHFHTDRRHPHGWRADQVTLAVARRFRIPVGKIARGHHRIRSLKLRGGPLSVVNRAWRVEREHTGRRFDVSVATGRLEVTELRKPAYMLLLGPEAIDAVIQQLMPANFATAVVVKATVRHGGKRRHLSVRVVSDSLVNRYGYILRTIRSHGKTEDELRKHGKGWLARQAKPRPTVTIQHPGIPWVTRGDAVEADLVRAGIRRLVYVKNASHQLAAGDYTMDLTLGLDDPFIAKREPAPARSRRRS